MATFASPFPLAGGEASVITPFERLTDETVTAFPSTCRSHCGIIQIRCIHLKLRGSPVAEKVLMRLGVSRLTAS